MRKAALFLLMCTVFALSSCALTGVGAENHRFSAKKGTGIGTPETLSKEAEYDKRMGDGSYYKLSKVVGSSGLRLREGCRLLRLNRLQEVPMGEVSPKYGVEQDGKRYALSVRNAALFFRELNGVLFRDFAIFLLMPGLVRVVNDDGLRSILKECSDLHPEWLKEQPSFPVESVFTLPGSSEHIRITMLCGTTMYQADYEVGSDGSVSVEKVRVVLQGPRSQIRSLPDGGDAETGRFYDLIRKHRPDLTKRGSEK